MHRVWIAICFVCGALLIAAALLVPSHLRAVDAKIIERAGAPTPSLALEGMTLADLEKIGPARMLLQAAQAENLRDAGQLATRIASFSRQNPELVPWGGADPLLEKVSVPGESNTRPVVELLMQRGIRENVSQVLQDSRRRGVQQILKTRTLTNTVHFPAVGTASGQALEGAILIAALLFQGDDLTAPLRDTIEFLALQSNRGGDSASLELVYLDLLSLGKRLDWVSLTEFVKRIEDIATMRQLSEIMRSREDQAPILYSAVQVSGQPQLVAKYLSRFPETGLNDLAFAARMGSGGIDLLLKQQRQVYFPRTLRNTVTGYDPFGAWFYSLLPMSQSSPRSALLLKYAFLLCGSLCLARVVGVIGGSTQWRGLRLGADSVLALALAFIVALVIEPFVGLPTQIKDLPIRLHIPTAGAALGSPLKPTSPLMKELSLIPLVVFFVIQALIYVWCLAKLNEIRRQPLAPNMKLRLLENEDHLFDAGLYIGFVGTIIALMLAMLGVSNFAPMAAYSSTSFGIIFVSVLKIFHVRPMRRKLIIESELT